MSASRTYAIREKKRAWPNGEFGAVDCLTTETVHADGRVERHVVGVIDGQYVDQRATDRFPGPIDMDKAHAYRIGLGFREIAS